LNTRRHRRVEVGDAHLLVPAGLATLSTTTSPMAKPLTPTAGAAMPSSARPGYRHIVSVLSKLDQTAACHALMNYPQTV
jgi:hypothetical protein